MSREISVLYFAAARELAGVAAETIELPVAELSGEQLLLLLGERHPRLAAHLSRMRLAVNDELGDLHVRLRAGDSVAILPPVAGGAEIPAVAAAARASAIRAEKLSVDEAIAAVSHPGAGGVVVFLGIVRDHAQGKAVTRLDYEAHATLADKELTRILAELQQAQPGVRVFAAHRVGELEIGEVAVVVAASAAHRAQAFSAARSAIDLIKEHVPVWKKEWTEGGDAHWVNLEG